MRTSIRFDWPILAKILRKFTTLTIIILHFFGCSVIVIVIVGKWAFLLIEKCHTATMFLTCSETTTFLQNLVVSHFFFAKNRKNDAGLWTPIVVPWENLKHSIITPVLHCFGIKLGWYFKPSLNQCWWKNIAIKYR